MFKFIKQITAPIVFSKGLSQYNQRQYHIAQQLLNKAAQWMPELHSDALYCAVMSLCAHHLNVDPAANTDQFKSLYDALLQSPRKDTPNYLSISAEIKDILDVAS